jgi:hypothetical protein
MSGAISVRMLIATLGLLACATAASAECACVLWDDSVAVTLWAWEIVGGGPMTKWREWILTGSLLLAFLAVSWLTGALWIGMATGLSVSSAATLLVVSLAAPVVVGLGIWHWRWGDRHSGVRFIGTGIVALCLMGVLLLHPNLAYERALDRLADAEDDMSDCTPSFCDGESPPHAERRYKLHREEIARRRAEYEAARLYRGEDNLHLRGGLILLGFAVGVYTLAIRRKDFAPRRHPDEPA